jgi:hypothetical protein
MIVRVLAFVPFALVLALVLTDFYIFNFNWVAGRFALSPISTALAGLVFNVVIILLLVSYVRCTFTSSAQVDHPPPVGWNVNDPAVRRCQKCDGAPKAPRAHHCSMCGTWYAIFSELVVKSFQDLFQIVILFQCSQNGSPLPLGCELCRLFQLQGTIFISS